MTFGIDRDDHVGVDARRSAAAGPARRAASAAAARARAARSAAGEDPEAEVPEPEEPVEDDARRVLAEGATTRPIAGRQSSIATSTVGCSRRSWSASERAGRSCPSPTLAVRIRIRGAPAAESLCTVCQARSVLVLARSRRLDRAVDSLNPSTVGPALLLALGANAKRDLAAFLLGVFGTSTLGGLILVLGPGPRTARDRLDAAAAHRASGRGRVRCCGARCLGRALAEARGIRPPARGPVRTHPLLAAGARRRDHRRRVPDRVAVLRSAGCDRRGAGVDSESGAARRRLQRLLLCADHRPARRGGRGRRAGESVRAGGAECPSAVRRDRRAGAARHCSARGSWRSAWSACAATDEASVSSGISRAPFHAPPVERRGGGGMPQPRLAVALALVSVVLVLLPAAATCATSSPPFLVVRASNGGSPFQGTRRRWSPSARTATTSGTRSRSTTGSARPPMCVSTRPATAPLAGGCRPTSGAHRPALTSTGGRRPRAPLQRRTRFVSRHRWRRRPWSCMSRASTSGRPGPPTARATPLVSPCARMHVI